MSLFSRSQLRGTQGARLIHHGASLGPGRAPRGACSGRSKSRNLASSHGVAFRARAEQGDGNPTCQLFCSTAVKALYFVAPTVQQQSHIKVVWTTTTTKRVWTLHMHACLWCVCYDTCACVEARAGLLFVCWNPTFQLCVFFCSACCCSCCRIMSVSHRPSSPQALYFVAGTVQQ